MAFRPFLRQNAFFARPNAFAVVLLEKNAAWCDRLGDYSTALGYEPSNIVRRSRGGERSSIFLIGPTHEESSPYYEAAAAESLHD